MSGRTQKRKRGVAKRREILRYATAAGAALVFAPRHIADPVKPVFDAPVATVERKQIGCRHTLPAKTGNRVGHFRRDIFATDACPLNADRLGKTWPVNVPGQTIACLQLSNLDPAMPFADGTVFVQMHASHAFGVGGKGRG